MYTCLCVCRLQKASFAKPVTYLVDVEPLKKGGEKKSKIEPTITIDKNCRQCYIKKLTENYVTVQPSQR